MILILIVHAKEKINILHYYEGDEYKLSFSLPIAGFSCQIMRLLISFTRTILTELGTMKTDDFDPIV